MTDAAAGSRTPSIREKIEAAAREARAQLAEETSEGVDPHSSVDVLVVRPLQETGETPRTTGRRAIAPAALVGAGILLSRVIGVARDRIFAHYFGTTIEGDAFSAAIRIPNLLNNLFGEGVLSASFIPVYAPLARHGDDRAAGEVAGGVLALLVVTIGTLVLLGVAATPALIAVIAPGFTGAKRDLTIVLVRILFPGAGLMALSAWCLGILNSHRRFFLSYAAPVVWNAAMIATLLAFGARRSLPRLAVLLAWGSVVGSALMIAVQLPAVLRLVPKLRLMRRRSAHVREVVRGFGPVFVGRGVVQISAYVDQVLASLLVTGSVAVMRYAQALYTLPVSLFGMSISASELPEMASVRGSDAERAAALRARIEPALRRIAFFIVPSAMALLALGDVVAGAVYQTGKFGPAQARWLWATLAGSAVGLLASTMGRVYSSAFYALRDTRTPLRFAMVRVALTLALGYLFAVPLPRAAGLGPTWGTAGLTASAGVAGWIEFLLLRRALGRRVGPTSIPARFVVSLWGAALAAAAAALAVKAPLAAWHPVLRAVPVLGSFGLTYFAATVLAGVPESGALLSRVRRRPARR